MCGDAPSGRPPYFVHSPRLIRLVCVLVPLGAVAATGFSARLPIPATPQLRSPPPGYPGDEATLAHGRTLFAQLYARCPVLDRDGIGPPLGGATRVLSQAEFLRHTRNPAAVIESGNLRANAWFRRYTVVLPPLVFFARRTARRNCGPPRECNGEIQAHALRRRSHAADLQRGPADSGRRKIFARDRVGRLGANFSRREPPARQGPPSLRSSPRRGGAVFTNDQIGVIYPVKDRNSAPRPSSVCTIRLTRRPGRSISLREKVGRG